ncbi:MAG TPA: hypothetical protein VJ103_01480 [Candidatus Paceibacterota bacterium]|nr:hypothetical protein [Candidatus Paceibacterota bacterium]
MLKQKTQITNTAYFSEMQKRAVELMQKENLNTIAIPNGFGYYLVKANTEEAKQREKDGLIVFKTTISDAEYLVAMA